MLIISQLLLYIYNLLFQHNFFHPTLHVIPAKAGIQHSSVIAKDFPELLSNINYGIFKTFFFTKISAIM